ncbi:DUF748 domain-containing protein [Hydrogenophaga sp.]|uniref:DUF748 domain-containing protein n=1 Tax=Hydrogenophaga sp. TaxID=1904254 RepID=UPI0026223A76|nr:DUF748 domain-containing protein [Hydrogenophaga sp.]MCW5654110.1 DUF748 domain-containing protein [Hydrogenophaga sp.]
MNLPTFSWAASRWLRRLLIALGVLALVWLLSWLAVPPLLKWQLEKQASQALGRAVTVQRVDFRPWSLELSIEGLQVAGLPGSGPQFTMARVYANAELQSLFRLAPVIDRLSLEQPRLTLRHLGEGRYDIDDVLQRLRPSESGKPGEPSLFALFNMSLVGGELEFIDDAKGVTHRLTQLEVGVPFLSNLPSRREVVTEPRLAFVLNGSAFDSHASSTPFAQSHRTDARVEIPALDLTPYLPYWPAQWPLQPQAGTLELALKVDFEDRDAPRLVLSGAAALSGLRIVERASAASEAVALLSWERLALDLHRVEPLARRAELTRVLLKAPQLHLSRDGQGRLNLERMAQAWSAPAVAAEVPATPAAPAPPAPDWQVQVGQVVLESGLLQWSDAAVRPAADLRLEDMQAQVQDLRWPMATPAAFELRARLGQTPLSVQGSASAREAQAQVALGELPLPMFAPYLQQVLVPEVDGRLSADLQWRWQAAQDTRPQVLVAGVSSLRLDRFRLGPARRPLASLAGLEVREAVLDLAANKADVGQVKARGLQVQVLREKDGRWQAQDWVRAAQPAAEQAPGVPWRVTLADVSLDAGHVALEDRLPARPVSLDLRQIRLQVRNLQPLAAEQPDMPVSLQLQLAGGEQGRVREAGKLSLNGNLRLPGEGGAGLRVKTRVQAEQVPLHVLEPYFGDALNMELVRADAGFRGTVEAAMPASGLSLALEGQVSVDDLQANTLAPAEDLLAWKSLQVRGLRLALAPGQPLRLAVQETVLSDYFARVIVDESGRFNLQGLVKSSDSAPASAQAASSPPADIRFGPVSLVHGRVLFSDRFIKPNYSANLSEVTGSLSAFGSTSAGAQPAMADLTLRGRAEGTASLEIDGQLNPLAQPLALDIRGRVRNLELPPLSPYSAKYAGYGIDRGKLSVDVSYKVEPDGRLSANNQIVLNQLSFGERVAGSEAPNLPVKLAVALLADRNGVIDINLPISGSLNDPEFRIGPLIFRLIFNLIGKAVTAPFSLIASAFGGGPEMSQVAFPAGRAVLDGAARQQLDAVAKALADRPALQVTVVGHADLESERTGYQRARLDQLVLAEKRRVLARTGTPPAEGLTVSPDEYPALLKEAYRRADIPKPRNLIGIAKDLPQAEMEALLMAAAPVSPDLLRELAVARAVAVKDYLASRELAQDRLFLGAPLLGRQGDNWRPQAELRLAPR